MTGRCPDYCVVIEGGVDDDCGRNHTPGDRAHATNREARVHADKVRICTTNMHITEEFLDFCKTKISDVRVLVLWNARVRSYNTYVVCMYILVCLHVGIPRNPRKFLLVS